MDKLHRAGAGLSRRHFLYAGTILGGGLLAAPALARQLCRSTAGDILGPYYRFGAPFLSKLAGPDEPGERLVVSGTVLSASSVPMPILNHLRRKGSLRKVRSAVPNPVQTDTLTQLTSTKARAINSTERSSAPGTV